MIFTPPEETALEGGFFVSGAYLTLWWSSGSSPDPFLFAKTQLRPRISLSRHVSSPLWGGGRASDL